MTTDEVNTELIRQIATLKERIGGLEFDLESSINLLKEQKKRFAKIYNFNAERGYGNLCGICRIVSGDGFDAWTDTPAWSDATERSQEPK